MQELRLTELVGHRRKRLLGERKKSIDKFVESGIINVRGESIMNINNIDSPIEQRNTGKGNPNAIIHADRPLNKRQQRILDRLPSYDSSVIVHKRNMSMKDLSALTAYTGDEFAMFTRKNERLVIRGNTYSVNVNANLAISLSEDGYRWSGHTHPGINQNASMPSAGDKAILRCFKQAESVIYNSKGEYRTFGKE